MKLITFAFAAATLAACSKGSMPTALPTASTLFSEASSATTGQSTCTTADGVNDACSCDADARRSCSGFYSSDWQSYARAYGYTTASWKLGLLDCLAVQDVSEACTASLARREALNQQMTAACSSYCRGTKPQPGAEPCVDKLKSIYSSLDSTCKTALDAHQAAKPIKERAPF
jgi:hypothetical protein